MKGTLRALAALLLTILAAASAPSASAASDTSGNQITRWDAVWLLHDDGSATVQVEIDFDFGDDPGHGPYFTFPTEVDYGDGEHLRVYDIHDVSASSPTGAPAHTYVDESGGVMTVRIGDESIGNVSGVQTYVLRYTIDHVMNATTAEELGGTGDEVVQDEFYYNVIGDQWTIPISDVSVTVFAEPEATEVLCWAGPTGSTTACDSAETEGGMPTFTQSTLSAYEGLTVAIAYPAGSFDTEPELMSSNLVARGLAAASWLSWGWAAWVLGVLAVGGVLIGRKVRKGIKDDAYEGMAPGLAPPPGEYANVGTRDPKAPVAVRFTPPDGVRPGHVGTIFDEKADPRDVTATIVDLAVRGYLRIDPVRDDEDPTDVDDFTLVRLCEPDGSLAGFEATLLSKLFLTGPEVRLDDLRTTFRASLVEVQHEMHEDMREWGWFYENPQKQRQRWLQVGSLMIAGGFFMVLWAGVGFGLPLLTLPFGILGIAMLATARKLPRRTAEGSKVLAQAQGFHLYLATAEAEQIRVEESQDLFSRYLPFAIAFGLAGRWAALFEEVAARGVALPEPAWYGGGYAAGTFWAHSTGFGESMSYFETLASSALSAPTPGSSGGSGFSGGGSSGGGGGGGGGGGW